MDKNNNKTVKEKAKKLVEEYRKTDTPLGEYTGISFDEIPEQDADDL